MCEVSVTCSEDHLARVTILRRTHPSGAEGERRDEEEARGERDERRCLRGPENYLGAALGEGV